MNEHTLMRLPDSLRLNLDAAMANANRQKIQSARRHLTQQYQTTTADALTASPFFMKTPWDRLSYLATRMPATYAVCCRVLCQLQNNETKITSLLDLGAGPGTVLWAAHTHFAHLKDVTLIEQDDALLQAGMALFDTDLRQKNITALSQSMTSVTSFKIHDLVCLSYALGELPKASRAPVMQAAWHATEKFLILIEPGTPHGFQRIKEARQHLIEQDAFIIAPCPHDLNCPMTQTSGDWCHFSQRLERNFHHRQMKESSLPYEDEKYSYIIAAKAPQIRPQRRILRRPKQGSGHLILDLCTADGLEREVVSKKTPALYRLARQARWGDPAPDLEDRHISQDTLISKT